jgi:uncharacterized protein (TIGR02597 family)
MIRLPFILLALWAMAAVAADPVIESPAVGYEIADIPGADANGPSLTFKASRYLCSVARVGVSTTLGVDSLTDVTAPWSEGLYNGGNGSHYLEIMSVAGSVSAPQVGATRTILSTLETAKQVTFTSPLPTGLSGTIGYRIVKHWTLGKLFGVNNSVGLKGGSAITADQVQLWDGSNHESYYYQTAGIGGTGWRKAGDQVTDASSKIILPTQAIIIKRGDAQPLTVLFQGDVKNGKTPVTVAPGFNFIANPYSAAMTLASCSIYSGDSVKGLAGGNIVTADQIMVWNGSIYQIYYYQRSGIGGIGWRRAGDLFTDASTAAIPAGSSVIVWRQGNVGFEWVMPQHPAS